jgi:hypothetical protein
MAPQIRGFAPVACDKIGNRRHFTGIQMPRFIGFLLGVFLLAGCDLAPKPAATPTPQLISTPTPLVTPAQPTPLPVLDDPLAELRQITQVRQTGLLDKAGWLHRVLRQNGQVNNFMLASVATPGQVDREEWWLLDGSGGVKAALQRILAADGKTSQTSILTNGAWHTPDSQVASSALLPGTYQPDLGYLALAERLEKSNQTLNRQVLYQDCWNLGVHFSILDGKTLHDAVFNPDNGKLRWLKDWDTSTGSPVLRDSEEVLVEEQVAAPPADVLVAMGQY